MQHDLSIAELAQVTGLHPGSIRRLATQGKIEGCYKLGGSWRIRRDAISTIRGQKFSQAGKEPIIHVDRNTKVQED